MLFASAFYVYRNIGLMKFDLINVTSYLMTFQVLVFINEKVMTLFYKEMVVVLLNKNFKFIVIFWMLQVGIRAQLE